MTGGRRLHRSFGFSEAEGLLDAAEAIAITVEPAGPLGQAFTSGRPSVVEPMIAIPVAPQGRVTAVMALYF